MDKLLTPDIIRVTNNVINQTIATALQDFNSRVLPDDRIDDIYTYFNDKRQHNPYPKLQNMLFTKLSTFIQSQVLHHADRHVRCLFLQFQHKKCHNWLQTDPWLVKLSNMEFMMALYRRFRIPILPAPTACPACRHRVMDIYCDHATMCSSSSQNCKTRHDSVKLLLCNMGKLAGLKTKLEQNPTTAVTANIKPADVLFENYNHGDHLAVDVTVISPFRGGLDNGATTTYMYTGDQTYLDKLGKYKSFTFKPCTSFQPFVIEEFGAVHKEGMLIFNRLCEFIAIRQNKPVTQIKFQYSKLLSTVVQRQNSRAILSRLHS